MKISDVVCCVPRDPRHASQVFVLIRTDAGLTGVGEGSLSYPKVLSDQVGTAILGCRESLLGQDPTRIGRLWDDLYHKHFWGRGATAMTALGAIEQALWDITGQDLGVPVHRLLGGAYHDRIPLYHNIRFTGSLDELIAKARTTVAGGATRVKWYPFHFLARFRDTYHVSSQDLTRAVDEVHAMRDALGPGVELMVDLWRRLDLISAIRFCNSVEDVGLLFVEEAVLAENVDVMVKLSHHVNVRLAAGERVGSRSDFRSLIELQAVGVVQPDVPRVGGISETLKIAALAEAYGIGVIPHNPTGSIATAAAVHACACLRNGLMLERIVRDGTDPHAPFAAEPFVDRHLTYGPDFIELPTAPGIGTTLHEELLRELPQPS